MSGDARTAFHGRLLIVERRRSGWTQAHIAAAMGIWRKCVKTWITGTRPQARWVCTIGPRVHIQRRPALPMLSKRALWSCAVVSDAARTGSAPNWNPGPCRQPGLAPSSGALPVRVRPDDRCAHPIIKDHSGAL